MGRKVSEEARRQREELRQRVQWVLENLFAGRQRRMAAAMAMSQSLISRVTNGQQGAGADFLEALKRLPGLNPRWVESGEGEPLLPPTKGSLPVARGILPDEPASCPELLTGERHPVAEAFERSSRYWVRLPPGAAVLKLRELALLPGDLLLFESDKRAWEGHLSEHGGQVCGVRVLTAGTVRYEMALLKQDADGLICVLVDVPAPKEPSPFGRRSRSIDLGEASSPTVPQQTTAPVEAIVAVRVYTGRP